MKIASGAVSLASTHGLHEEYEKKESLRLWVGNERLVFDGEEEPSGVQVRISPEARQIQQVAAQFPAAGDSAAAQQPEASSPEDPKLKAMRLILEALTGRKIRISTLESFSSKNIAPYPGTVQGVNPEDPPIAGQGWGLEYDLVETVNEQESMTFSASGQVVTADGQTIDFQLQLAMQREFAATNSVQVRAGDALLVDPLVINFNGKAAELSNMRFGFDLDGDGDMEQIPGLAPGSGFLAFDRNHDGLINNGLELFGPATGMGFSELARLDSAGNGWLDENDPLYAELRIWMRDEAGKESLASLAEKNVGAIFLNPVETDFALKNSDNGLLGQLRESSIFLVESGGAGTVQEIDLAV
ncbi:MAG: VCBS repeat-containing protein [Desulfurivibrio sp.]|nr:VCBS repeat-containing protein [Desulfurivibrio sp.]MBU4117322.1 VCBS repeat-containing protein [Pseudomonadota bacterium]